MYGTCKRIIILFCYFQIIFKSFYYRLANHQIVTRRYCRTKMIDNDSKGNYPFALISSNFSFDEWKNREEGFRCTDTSPMNQYVMLCEDKWKSVFDELDFHKEGAAHAELTLNIVLILIASQLALILGLVAYILRNHATRNDSKSHSNTCFDPSEVEIENEECQTPIIMTKHKTVW